MHKSYKKALVIGGSRGAGRAIALRLAEQGVATTVVAREQASLQSLSKEDDRISTICQNAAGDSVAKTLIAKIQPDLLVLCVGHKPTMKPFFEQSWDEFSGAWNADTRVAHSFMSAAIQQPMPQGSTIVSFSSGAALSGSRLTGGYAGAKRMQHFIAEYAQREAKILDLRLNFLTIIPKQLMLDTVIGREAAEAYATVTGKTLEEFAAQWDAPLTPEKTGEHVLNLLAQEPPFENHTYVVTGSGMSAFD